jgi:hypothetical protein
MGAVVTNAELPLDEGRDLGAGPGNFRHAELSRDVQKDPEQPGQIARCQPPWTADGRPCRHACFPVGASCGSPTAHAAWIDVRKAGHFSRGYSVREQAHSEQSALLELARSTEWTHDLGLPSPAPDIT